MKCGLNRIKIKLFTQQMGWLDGKEVELHPWGPNIKFHKWYSLWSTLECWPNISYLFILPMLSGDMCQQLIRWKIMKFKIIEIKIYYITYIIYNNKYK
jgi:hypothetical protein